jgi:hypothetical protein
MTTSERMLLRWIVRLCLALLAGPVLSSGQSTVGRFGHRSHRSARSSILRRSWCAGDRAHTTDAHPAASRPLPHALRPGPSIGTS